ncbi:uncharacterized protein N7515_005411 [Penicillium bovifimosum]|uniref:protoporphyrinogen oxidase n=1 Tax=Penicillium bovifimosum TaxID=126998 RepID=A0A9W9GSQ1_9EURO|nr:uncharacterized protein N7515_005411 [Penicillium bovifimosum]KAJ5129372.1 hypothetical protein N7515_005411 [Penicillium bovifimosum]
MPKIFPFQDSAFTADDTMYNPIFDHDRAMAGGNGVETRYAFAFFCFLSVSFIDSPLILQNNNTKAKTNPRISHKPLHVTIIFFYYVNKSDLQPGEMLPKCASKALRPGQKQLNSLLHAQQRRGFQAFVLGGGITGLTSAWQLSQNPNCTSVVLVEKSNRLGGWIDSETIPVDGGNVVFEYGPRTLKSSVPESLPLLYLVNIPRVHIAIGERTSYTNFLKATNLGLYNELIVTPKSSPAAQNRYIYYPDHLVRIPAPKPSLSFGENFDNFLNTMKEPLFNKFLSGIVKDIFAPPRHPTQWAEDESVADFIGRRFGPDVADNLVSAIFHGVYAGDIDQLSAQTLLGSVRNLEGGIGGVGGFVSGGVTASLLSRAFSRKKIRRMDDFMAVDAISAGPELVRRQHDLEILAAEASTFTFKRGVGQLVEGLVASLKANKKVTIILNTEVDTMVALRDNKTAMRLNGKSWYESKHIISTIPPAALGKAMQNPKRRIRDRVMELNMKEPGFTPHLLQKQNYAVTVMVVNLYYSDPDLLPVEDGFGYLIPRSIPYEQNPECGLGVIFASSSSVGNSTDSSAGTIRQDSARGTKLTVMLGGHYWDGFEEYPDHDTAVKMAREMLRRHMNITDTPTVARSRLQENAIPQHTVGHLGRMYRLSKTVRDEFDGSLVLAGSWYNGVGVGDCVRQGILSATYGMGTHQLSGEFNDWRPWVPYHYDEWALKGGIVMSPIRLVDSKI